MKIMNNSISFCLSGIFMLSILVLSSCGDDSIDDILDWDKDYPLEKTIWGQTSLVAVDCDYEEDIKSEKSDCTQGDCNTMAFIDGIANFSEMSRSWISPYKISGNTIIMEYLGFTLSFKYSISGNSLTMVFTNPYTGCEETRKYYGRPSR